ncbi:MAG: LemA family protein, partial [Bacteroidales bacterium]|nr:LemA family protein [Bacteroidales bacterium]
MKLSKTLIVIIIVIVLALISIWIYNRLVTSEETVNKAWANVESVYQRRADLIGNLVQTVQGAADFERGTLTDVVEARANATSVKIDPA